MQTFREFLDIMPKVEKALNAQVTLPEIDPSILSKELPTLEITSKILRIEKNKNPINIMLEDGTSLYLTWDEFKRIPGDKPEIGKSLKVVFQRLSHDKTEKPSKIKYCKCF